ncbi:tubulin delta chain-like isoform X2 [Apis dorsata]|uniref:tubulin delta chain-like isoform X2 n=1 Tax=Apis dorsata TaxID=7462 RepID=UPI001293E4B3|nr:tubulin delta chain-like isoform X2 [Apis dorsata]
MLTIQFGQCGNQLGHTLFSEISTDMECVNTGVSYKTNYQYIEDTFNRWFSGITKSNDRLARAILIDTEQKVINKIYNNKSNLWTYSTKNVICQAGGGCANNWAFGYLIKGGTGSGIGSYITKLLHEEYNKKSILNTTILPFSFGEVCTQNYNTLLTLAKLYNESDINILFENEQIYNICTSLLKKSSINLQDMNKIISKKLLATFQPVNYEKHNINSLLSQIACHPSYKIAIIKSTPHIPVTSTNYEPIYNWNSYIHHLKQTLRIPNLNSQLTNVELKMPSNLLSNTIHHTYATSVSNVLITRGTMSEQDLIMKNILKEKHLYANWNTIDWFTHLHQNRKFLNHDKFLALITNNSQISYSLDIFLNKTWKSYVHSAFLHQYKQFGLEEDDFLQAFSVLENVVKEYKELVSHTD